MATATTNANTNTNTNTNTNSNTTTTTTTTTATTTTTTTTATYITFAILSLFTSSPISATPTWTPSVPLMATAHYTEQSGMGMRAS